MAGSHREGSDFACRLYDAVRAALDPDGASAPSLELPSRPDPSLLPTLAALEARFDRLLPPELAAEARRVAVQVAARNLITLSALERLSGALEAEGLRWAAVKGIDHLARIYPGPEWRAMTDLDLLVHPDDVERAHSILESCSFRVHDPRSSRMNPGLAYTDDRTSVDLHRMLHRPGTCRVPTAVLLEGSALHEIQGIPVRLLESDRCFVALSLLAARNFFAPPHLSALRMVELALAADRLDDEALASWRRRMTEWRARRIFDRALELVAWIRGSAAPRWIEPGMGEAAPEPRSDSRWTSYRRRMGQLDGPTDVVRYAVLEGWMMSWRAVTGRRAGRWHRT